MTLVFRAGVWTEDGDKIALVPYVDGATKINYVYQIRHSGADFVRMMVI